ncbi:MAG TPA: myxococcus cysteine-rich repeat containing protein, partial [Candidatus Binatia bacterium]|nr:myxococcus cysteine-rich repeat containing protein [Candidatus Binatia bacterium]
MTRRLLARVALALGLAVAGAGDVLATLDGFPAPVRGWETVPGVVRADGVGVFRLEVELDAPVASVMLEDRSSCLAADGPARVLHDDGLDGDRVAGDLVYTSAAFRYVCAPPGFLRDDPSSPAGVDFLDVGTVEVMELDGTVDEFLGRPAVGLLAPGVAPPPTTALGADVVVAPHLVNVRSEARATQRLLRFPGDDLAGVTRAFYAVLPDAVDFFVFFSTAKLELLPRLSSRNFVAGSHRSVRVDFTGTGQSPFDNGAVYGSRGRLLGVNALDTYGRGIVGNVATHELQHQWAAFLSPALGLSDGIHYGPRTNAGSLLGGFRWIDDGAGGFVLDCTEGRSGAFHAAPLDLYLMGLVPGTAVAPLRVAAASTLACGQEVGALERTIRIEDIQSVYGVRTPGPDAAQRDFRIAFVAETHGRLLAPQELAFYETLAAHYTRPLGPSEPDPYHGSGQWSSIARFFGAGTTWRGDILTCGNATVELAEECDDGNGVAGDGCTPDCRREASEQVVPVTVAPVGSFNPRGNGFVGVTVLSANGVDVRALDVATLRFGKTGTEAAPVDAGLRDAD